MQINRRVVLLKETIKCCKLIELGKIWVINLKNTSLTALGGIITALSVLLMILAGVIPNVTYVIPAFSGMLLILTVQEADLKWSFFIYAAVSILSLLIVADKEAAVMYVFFFGYYPAVKELYERHFGKILQIIFKMITFNVTIILGYLLLIYIFMIPIEGFDTFGKWTPFILLLIGNVVFWVYDFLITMLNSIYRKKVHPRISHLFRN